MLDALEALVDAFEALVDELEAAVHLVAQRVECPRDPERLGTDDADRDGAEGGDQARGLRPAHVPHGKSRRRS